MIPPLLATLLTGVLMLPLILEPGLSRGHDVGLHVGNVVESAYLLEHSLPPWDWLPDVAGGYGGPNYIYYGHLGFVLPALLVNAGASPVAALKFATAFAFALGALSSYLWCASLGGRIDAFAGMTLFVTGPYFLGLPYARAAYPEFFAYSLYPLALLLAQRWMRNGRARYMVGCALVVTAVVSIHTLSLILLVPFLAISATLSGCVDSGGAPRRVLLRVSGLFAFTAILGAHFLVGALFETHKVGISGQFATAELYESLGVPWYSMFNSEPLQDRIVSRAVPGRFHLIACGVAFAAAISVASRLRASILWRLGLALVALFLCEATLAPLASTLAPPLRYLQFPWRWLGIFNLFCTAAFARSFHESSSLAPSVRTILAVATPIVCLWIYAGNIPPQGAIDFRTDTREELRNSLSTLDHEDKYMPAGSKRPVEPAPIALLAINDPRGRVRVLDESPNDYRFEIETPGHTTGVFHQYFFDGWRCEVDGRRVAIDRVGDLGICGISIRAGLHEVRFRFTRPPLRAVGFGLSIAAFAVASLVMTMHLIR